MAGPFKEFLRFTYNTLSSYTLKFNDDFNIDEMVTRTNDNGDGTTTVMCYVRLNGGILPTKIQFYNSVGLLKVHYVNTSNLTTMKEMFSGCANLTEIEGIEDWDVSNVTDMDSAFRDVGLTELDLSKWDVRKVTTMRLMFYISALQSINITGWKTYNLQNTFKMFSGCSSLVEILGINDLNVSKITDLGEMFSESTQLAKLDLSNWDVSRVTTLANLFHDCVNLKSLSLSNWNTNKVTDMSFMFYNCNNLESISLLDWDTSNVKNMSYLFYDCKKLPSLNLLNWNTMNVTNMSFVFHGCESMTCIDLSNWNTSSVTDMSYMIYDCKKLKTLNLSGIKMAMVTSMENMLTSIVSNELDSVLLYDVSFSTVNKIINLLSDVNPGYPRKIYVSKRVDISKINVNTANSKYWQVVQGDLIKASNKGNVVLNCGDWLGIKIKRIHIGDTKILRY